MRPWPPTTGCCSARHCRTIHPMEAKKQLASRIVERFHSAAAAEAALEDFNKRFSKKDLASAELPEVDLQGASDDILSAVVVAFEKGFSITKSRGDARRLVEQGSVQLRGEKITDQKAAPNAAERRRAPARQDACRAGGVNIRSR